MKKILVIDDEESLRQMMGLALRQRGYAVVEAENGAVGIQKAGAEQPDLILCDVNMEKVDGYRTLSVLRNEAPTASIPFILMTGLADPAGMRQGMELGADDYLPKPFNLDILLARIGSLLRRKKWQQLSSEPPSSQAPAEDQFRFDGKLVDFQRLQLQSGEKTYQLTLMELELLRYLIRNAGRPVSRKEILEQVWNLHEDTDTRAMDNFVVRLRRYIEKDPTKPKHLLTVRGLGYQFVIDPEQE
jgi:DNA-binding response OmpR family regulator